MGHIEAKNKYKRKKLEKEYKAKAKIHRDTVEVKLGNAPSIELSDEAGWQEFKAANEDSCGIVVVTYAERWARLMQIEMANGKKLEEVAETTSHEADTSGLTGCMYKCVFSALKNYWKHGDELRRWHNIDTQIGNEGEKVNETPVASSVLCSCL